MIKNKKSKRKHDYNKNPSQIKKTKKGINKSCHKTPQQAFNTMIKVYVLIFSFCLFCFLPKSGFGLSEIEIDALESADDQKLSADPWTIQLQFALRRNLEIENRYGGFSKDSAQKEGDQKDSKRIRFCDPSSEASICDLSNLYYGLGLDASYSLNNAEHFFNKRLGVKNDRIKQIIKNTKIFFRSSFYSPFKGNTNLENYSFFRDYIMYAVGDPTTGLTTQFYKSDNLLSYSELSVVMFPLSRFSRKAGLFTTLDGSIGFVRSLKKEQSWALAFSSNHNLAYSHYQKEDANDRGSIVNTPLDTEHSLGFSYKQSYNRFMPSSTRVSTIHYFGLNSQFTMSYFLTLASSFSWKIRKQFYINLLISWKDKIAVYNPDNENVRKKEPVRFNLNRTFFALSGSYFF